MSGSSSNGQDDDGTKNVCFICQQYLVPCSSMPISGLDLNKMSNWWRKYLTTPFSHRAAKNSRCCSMCIASARSNHEDNKAANPDEVWWPVIKAQPEIVPIIRLKRLSTDQIWRAIKCLPQPSNDIRGEIPNCKKHFSAASKPKPQKVFKCYFCSSKFKILGFRDRHHKVMHASHFQKMSQVSSSSGEKLNWRGGHQCPFCFSQFKTGFALIGHARFVHPLQHIRCPLKNCKTTLLGKDQFQTHLVIKHKNTHSSVSELALSMVKCAYTLCNKIFATEEQMDQHFKVAHQKEDGDMKCLFCSFRGVAQSSVIRHIRKYHNSSQPEERVKETASVQSNAEAENTNVEVQFQCGHCGLWRTPADLREHKSQVDCQHCKGAFPCRGLRNRHLWNGCSAAPKEKTEEGWEVVQKITFSL